MLHDPAAVITGFGAALLAASVASACSGETDLRDQLRGRWKVEAYQCSAQAYTEANVPARAYISVAFADDSAVISFSDEFCEATERWAASYEDDSQITLHDAQVSCAPNPCTKLTGERCDARVQAPAWEESFTVWFTNAAASRAVLHYRDDCNGTGELLPASLTLRKVDRTDATLHRRGGTHLATREDR